MIFGNFTSFWRHVITAAVHSDDAHYICVADVQLMRYKRPNQYVYHLAIQVWPHLLATSTVHMLETGHSNMQTKDKWHNNNYQFDLGWVVKLMATRLVQN